MNGSKYTPTTVEQGARKHTRRSKQQRAARGHRDGHRRVVKSTIGHEQGDDLYSGSADSTSPQFSSSPPSTNPPRTELEVKETLSNQPAEDDRVGNARPRKVRGDDHDENATCRPKSKPDMKDHGNEDTTLATHAELDAQLLRSATMVSDRADVMDTMSTNSGSIVIGGFTLRDGKITRDDSDACPVDGLTPYVHHLRGPSYQDTSRQPTIQHTTMTLLSVPADHRPLPLHASLSYCSAVDETLQDQEYRPNRIETDSVPFFSYIELDGCPVTVDKNSGYWQVPPGFASIMHYGPGHFDLPGPHNMQFYY